MRIYTRISQANLQYCEVSGTTASNADDIYIIDRPDLKTAIPLATLIL